MSSNASFSISTSGSVQDGFDTQDVAQSFSSLFGVPAEKAEAFVNSKKLIKKDLTREQVNVYQAKLSEIGLDVVIDGVDDDAALFSLVDEEPANESEPASVPKVADPMPSAAVPSANPASKKPLSASEMECPKCQLRQERSAECTGCGIFVEKFVANTGADSAAKNRRSQQQSMDDEDEFTAATLLLPLAAGVVGAIVWIVIASSFGYELGIVAWAIGGAIGFAATLTACKGEKIAVYCAVLALVSIMTGRYVAYSGFLQDEIEYFSEGGYIASQVNETMDMWRQEVAELESIKDDNSALRQFMVNNEYTDESNPSQISNNELAEFRDDVIPYLEDMVAMGEEEGGFMDTLNQPSAASTEYLASLKSMSTWQYMFDSFGLLDILFLFLGISSAYKLARDG